MVVSGLFVVAQYLLGKWPALRGVGARDLPEAEYPGVHRMVEDLSAEMGVEKPRPMVGRMGVANAFAVGRKGAGVVVVSETLLELLEPAEIEGVLAHEIAHVRNRDVTMMVLGQSVATIVGMATFWLFALADDSIAAVVVGYVVSAVLQALVMVFVLAISRYREYVADADAVDATGDPEALGRALAKIHNAGVAHRTPGVNDRVSALCIFGGRRGPLAKLFSTHPPMEKRVVRLAPHLLE